MIRCKRVREREREMEAENRVKFRLCEKQTKRERESVCEKHMETFLTKHRDILNKTPIETF